jgi:hypothetical protein
MKWVTHWVSQLPHSFFAFRDLRKGRFTHYSRPLSQLAQTRHRPKSPLVVLLEHEYSLTRTHFDREDGDHVPRKCRQRHPYLHKPTTKSTIRARHSSSSWSPASHYGGPASIPGQVMWDLCWTKWRRDGFSPSTSVCPVSYHSTDSFTRIIYHSGLLQ